MPSIISRARPEPRSLSGGAKAGISVGTIVGAFLILLCLWPIVARYRNRRRKQHVGPEVGPGELPFGVSTPPMAQLSSAPIDRRMSTDSYVHRVDSRLGDRQSAKDLTLGSSDGTDASTTRAPMAPPALPSAPFDTATGPSSSTGAIPPPIDTNMARMVASCETRGYSGSYYNTDIPSEAFGLDTSPTGNFQMSHPSPSRSPTRMSTSTLLESLFRRVTGSRGSSSSPSTVVGPISSHPDATIAAPNISESPTELEPEQNELSRSAEEKAARAVDLSQIQFPMPSSPPLAPPGQAPPGTVNPMLVMGAMTAAEQSWRTNAELMNMTATPADKPPVGLGSPAHIEEGWPTNAGDALGISMASPPESTHEPAPSTPSEDDVINYAGGISDPAETQFVPPNGIPDVTVKAEHDIGPTTVVDFAPTQQGVTSQQYTHQRHASSDNTYYTDHSTYSTPFPAPSPSGASTLNTPDTRITDTSPSPRPLATPEIKQGASPNPRFPLSPQSPQILVCDKCGQKFDQPHKLKYV